jgi:nickel-type superoxide dismutase maturation protease
VRWSARHYLVRHAALTRVPLTRVPLTRVVVVGDSMRPTLEPGDRLLVRRGSPVAAGDVVAVCDPRRPERVMVKRVASTSADGVRVLGDNAAASTDSRLLGPVPPTAVVGRVVYRYAPASRRGKLGPPEPGAGGTLGGHVVRRR